jgi:Na+-transporting methylmalonyl-CoA/oxaloacetate decarboxylase gamma subunit
MIEQVRAALELMALGMGMTFLSLGTLALGMYVMTAVLRGKEKVGLPELEDELPAAEEVAAYREGEFAGDINEGEEVRRRVAAAAVAVALALADAPSTSVSSPATQDPWNAFARSLHLSRRIQHEARRFRG